MEPDSNPFAPTSAPVVADRAAAPSGPLYNLAQIGTMTFLATPLGGAVLIGLNERQLGRPVGPQIGVGVLATIAVIAISGVLPANFPPIVVQLVSVFGVRAWAEYTQGADLAAHRLGRGQRRSWLAVVGIGLAVAIGLGAAVLGLILLVVPDV